jgi:hypothetical protein
MGSECIFDPLKMHSAPIFQGPEPGLVQTSVVARPVRRWARPAAMRAAWL